MFEYWRMEIRDQWNGFLFSDFSLEVIRKQRSDIIRILKGCGRSLASLGIDTTFFVREKRWRFAGEIEMWPMHNGEPPSLLHLVNAWDCHSERSEETSPHAQFAHQIIWQFTTQPRGFLAGARNDNLSFYGEGEEVAIRRWMTLICW